MSPQRRDVLRLGGVAALLTTGMAGCTEQLPSSSDDTTPTYADWLFDTDALFEAPFRGFYSVSVDAYLDQKAALPEEFRDGVQGQVDRYDGIELSNFDRITGVGAFADPSADDYGDERAVMTSVLTGEFDPETVTDTLTAESDLSAAGSYEGYDRYTHRSEYDPGDTRAAAVSGEAVVLTLVQTEASSDGDGTPSGTPQGGVTAGRAVELHVDANAGEADRLLAGNDRLDALAVALDGAAVGGLVLDPAMLRERTGMGDPDRDDSPESRDTPTPREDATTPTVSDPEPSPIRRHLAGTTRDLTAVGASADAAGGSGEVVVRLRYGSASEASDRAETVRKLREALRKEVDALTVPEVEVRTDGATVVVDITGDPTAFYEELRHTDDDRSARAPQVSFSFDRREDGRVTVTHDGGDEVGTDGTIGLLYESDGEGVERQWKPDDGSITAGDSITTDQPVTGALRVIWTSEGGDASATLGLYRPPEENEQRAPEASFDFAPQSDGSVTITHDGGDHIERGLIVRYDGSDSPEKWAEESGPITAGDSYTIRGTLAEDGSVYVIWPGDEPVVLAEFHTGPTPTPPERRTASGEGTSTPSPEERTPTRTSDGTPTGTPEDTPTRTPTEQSTDTRTATPSESGTPTRTETATPDPVGTSEGTATSTPSGN